eukprot:gnl/TRDRNA2_/TRDRNA2_87065_c0_seq1.p2 gnl/TRDRNA2_/TRDRNA2_87065_c0~~gnl/TRDRNA2_/TRDRNA2_87065_c0_seq1.p2  ORF type:complete len:164 (-),score=21.71 gnl/TRDRNA2_/TRDRNA2_87065_c0_seq1:258-749(-)
MGCQLCCAGGAAYCMGEPAETACYLGTNDVFILHTPARPGQMVKICDKYALSFNGEFELGEVESQTMGKLKLEDGHNMAERLNLTNVKFNVVPSSSDGEFEVVGSVNFNHDCYGVGGRGGNPNFPIWATGIRNDSGDEFLVFTKFEQVLEAVEHDEEKASDEE